MAGGLSKRNVGTVMRNAVLTLLVTRGRDLVVAPRGIPPYPPFVIVGIVGVLVGMARVRRETAIGY